MAWMAQFLRYPVLSRGVESVSYTHLDVYKRQVQVAEQLVADVAEELCQQDQAP